MAQKSAFASTSESNKRKKLKNGKGLIGDIWRNPAAYILVLPAMLYTLIYGYFTMPYNVIAFQKFSYVESIFNREWVGFDHFKFFFTSSTVWDVTFNTLRLNLMFLVTGTLFALIIAILINEGRSRLYLKVVQSTYLFPHFLSWIVVSYIVFSLFSTQYGFVNQLLEWAGISKFNWYSNPAPWPWILTIINIWKNSGLDIVIYLAAITAIDKSLYESAVVDGANRWHKIIYITVPLLYPTIAILTLLALGRIFQGDFGMIYAIIKDNGILFQTTDVIDTYVFRAFRISGDPAQATAIGLYQSVVGLILVFAVNSLVRKLYPDGALY